MTASAPHRTYSTTTRFAALSFAVACSILCSSPTRADFSVVYRVRSATLELFGKEQPSPFSKVGARILIKGDRVRVEATDHWGTTHTWISDRATHTTWRLLPDKLYVTEAGGWACEGIPVQVAIVMAEGLARAGIDSLAIAGPTAAEWNKLQAQRTEWDFRARVFGLPQPVWVHASMYFPKNEADAFGATAVELYCGKKPGPSEWKSAFEQFLDLSTSGAGALATSAGLPIALDLSSNLGMGKATLVLEASDISGSAQDASLFRLPEGYRAAPASE